MIKIMKIALVLVLLKTTVNGQFSTVRVSWNPAEIDSVEVQNLDGLEIGSTIIPYIVVRFKKPIASDNNAIYLSGAQFKNSNSPFDLALFATQFREGIIKGAVIRKSAVTQGTIIALLY
jgi:hypothetical protein